MNADKITIYPITIESFQQDDFSGFRAYLTDIPAVESIDLTPEGALNDLKDVAVEWMCAAVDEMLDVMNNSSKVFEKIPVEDPIGRTAGGIKLNDEPKRNPDL